MGSVSAAHFLKLDASSAIALGFLMERTLSQINKHASRTSLLSFGGVEFDRIIGTKILLSTKKLIYGVEEKV